MQKLYRPIKLGVGKYYSIISGFKTYAWGDNNKVPVELPVANIIKIYCLAGNAVMISSNNRILFHNGDIIEETSLEYSTSIRKVCRRKKYGITIFKNGTIRGQGINTYGQLGLGHTKSVSSNKKINLTNVKSMKCQPTFVIALTSEGDVYSWGTSWYRLGLGPKKTVANTPQKLPLNNILSIDCRKNFCVALSKDHMFIWGKFDGRMYCEPHQVDVTYFFGNVTIKSVACADDYMLVMTSDGNLYSWGELHPGIIDKSDEPSFAHLTDPWDIYHLGCSKPYKIDISNVKKIKSGKCHSIMLTKWNEVYTMGYNDHGQLGIGSTDLASGPQKLDLFI